MIKKFLVVLAVFLFSSYTIVEVYRFATHTIKSHTYKEAKKLKPFMYAIGEFESGMTYDTISKNGMLGAYQFSWSTALIHLRKWKMDTISKNYFLNHPTLQDSVMIENIKLNNKILHKYIKKYDGHIVYGIKITKSGVLAAAQFGPGKVINFFNGCTGKDSICDGNGVPVMYYMNKFAGYQLRHL